MARQLAVLFCVVSALSVSVPIAMGDNSQNAKSCQAGDWRSLKTGTGASFATEGACVSYGAQGGIYLFQQAQRDCESFGGTLMLGTTPVIWTCDGWENSGVDDYNAKFMTMVFDCIADAQGAGTKFSIISAMNIPGTVSTACERYQS